MSAPALLSLRCPNCGGVLVAPTPTTPDVVWFACPHCHSPVPVLAPRDPAPLFSWEVYPHLYPRLPAPTSPALRVPRVGIATLLALALFFAGFGGILAFDGAASLAPTSYTLAGTVVLNGSAPLSNATVSMSGENGFHASQVTNSTGGFSFRGVPAGGMELNASSPRYGYVTHVFFLNPLYQSVSINPTEIVVSLNGTPGGNDVTVVQTSFPDLETLVASLWSGAALVAVAAGVAALGVRAVRRGRPPTLAVAGGVGAVLVPIAVNSLGLAVVLPFGWVVSIVAIGLGTLTALLFLLIMARTGPSPST